MNTKKFDDGQAIIFLVFLLLPLLIFMGTMLDTARMFLEYDRMQRASDSAALAMAQELPPDTSGNLANVEQIGEEAIEYNIKTPGRMTGGVNLTDLDYTFDFYTGSDGETNTVAVNLSKTITTRMVHLLGYQDWTVSAQSVARSGPIAKAKNWVPIGIYDNGQVEVYEPMTLSNTGHTMPTGATSTQLIYEPLGYGQADDAFRDKKGISGVIEVGDRFTKDNTNNRIEDICDGYDDRIQLEHNVKGCYKRGQAPSGDINYVGPGEKKDWSFGNDPRLMYVPFVSNVNSNTVEVIGFGLFYAQYMHYDPEPFGGGSRPLTEIRGYFVHSIVEGKILDQGQNYGVQGIEYVDPEEL